MHRRTEECDAPAAGLHKIAHGVERTVVVVNHNARRIDAVADAVEEDERKAAALELAEMLVVFSVFRKRNDDAADTALVEGAAQLFLALVALVALAYDDTVAVAPRLFLHTVKHRGEIVVDNLRENNADNLGWLDLRVAEVLSHDVGREVVLAGILLDCLTPLLGDALRVGQGARDGGYRYVQSTRDVLHRDVFVVHEII